eukprot:Gb_27384 [translate_table: standard]
MIIKLAPGLDEEVKRVEVEGNKVPCMLERYKVPALFLAKNAVLPSFASIRATSLVVDCGGESIIVATMHDDYVLLKAMVSSPIVKRDSTRRISNDTTFDEVAYANILMIPYELLDGETIEIVVDRCKIPDLLFNPSSIQTIPNMEKPDNFRHSLRGLTRHDINATNGGTLGEIFDEDEVSTIVLDLGSHTCKVGYAGEDAPKLTEMLWITFGTMLLDDYLSIRCTIGGVRSRIEGPKIYTILVPESTLGQHFGEFLDSIKGADVSFEVDGEFFGSQIGACYSLNCLKCPYFGPMKDQHTVIKVTDMEAPVFKAMLHLIYWDILFDMHELTGSTSRIVESHCRRHHPT